MVPVKQMPNIKSAGVRLQRAFGFGKTKDFDPFLLLDDFRNDNPANDEWIRLSLNPN
jgi:quercetin 2,3-dioxygenase